MNWRTIGLSLAAGLIGGSLSDYLSPQLAHAESQGSLLKEVRAENFLLVNEKGVVVGRLSNDGARPAIRLFDEHGREIWSAGGSIGLQRSHLGK